MESRSSRRQSEDPPLRLPKGWGRSQSKRTGKVYYYPLDDPRLSQYEIPTEPRKGLGEKSIGEEEEEKVSVRHLLVKHRESRNPSSWREKSITRTKEEALKLVNGYRVQILGTDSSKSIEETFEELAGKWSDCGSARNGGELLPFGRGEMQKPFEDMAFSLIPGQVSEPIETASGVHIIFRKERPGRGRR